MPTTTLDRPVSKVVVPADRDLLVKPTIPRRAPRRPARVDSFVIRLERMGYERRLAAYRRGEFSRRQRTIWAARFPEEVPIVNGEFEWIGAAMADLD